MPLNNPRGGSQWTEAQDVELKRLGAERMSYRNIAPALNAMFDTCYTRSAVIGRAHRIGMCKTAAPNTRVRPPRKPRAPRPIVVKVNIITPAPYALRCVEVEPRNLSFLEIQPGECLYPQGEGSEIRFCGHPVFGKTSYCHPHIALTTGYRREGNNAVSEAQRRRIRGINYRRAILEGTA